MARKIYSEEFRRQAVGPHESTPGGALRGIAADPGVARGTLVVRVRSLGTGTTTAAVADTSPSLPASLLVRAPQV